VINYYTPTQNKQSLSNPLVSFHPAVMKQLHGKQPANQPSSSLMPENKLLPAKIPHYIPPIEKDRVLFSSGLPAGGTGIFNFSCEIAVIFDIHIYLFSRIPWPNTKS
jgi:hypothetical protein